MEALRKHRAQVGLPEWGIEEGGGLQYLADLQDRREALYAKAGRRALGNGRTYLKVHELCVGDLERQAKLEQRLQARSPF